MFFRNLQIYRLPTPWQIDLARLEEQLARGTFARCASHEPMSRGWVPPRKDGALIYSNNRQWLLLLTVEQRLLPEGVVNDEVQERAQKFTEVQGYPPGRKAQRELKELVTFELMPRAFTRKRSTPVWIDPQNGWLIVDASSQAKAEEVIEYLRFCLDELPLQLLHTEVSPQAAMADWLASGDAPAGFTIDRDCELKAIGEKSSARYLHSILDDKDGVGRQINEHLAGGKLPTKLALTWDERISFVLTEKLEIKRLAFLDLLKEEANKAAENAEDQFDADFALMTGELVRFLTDLVAALGGEKVDG